MKNNDFNEMINDLYESFKSSNNGDTRYKSWEWCHKAFLTYKEEYLKSEDETEKNKILDLLSLNLAFYLASWGMYRASSFLLKHDYKIHKDIVEKILDAKYSTLWDYTPSDDDNIKNAKELLFGTNNNGIYWEIKKAYGYKDPKKTKYRASDTLVTKILLGTFGCVPAFDRFFKIGISKYKNKCKNNGDKCTLTQNIEDKGGKTFTNFAKLALKYKNDFIINSDNSDLKYPPMKCIDMYFWKKGIK